MTTQENSTNEFFWVSILSRFVSSSQHETWTPSKKWHRLTYLLRQNRVFYQRPGLFWLFFSLLCAFANVISEQNWKVFRLATDDIRTTEIPPSREEKQRQSRDVAGCCLAHTFLFAWERPLSRVLKSFRFCFFLSPRNAFKNRLAANF